MSQSKVSDTTRFLIRLITKEVIKKAPGKLGAIIRFGPFGFIATFVLTTGFLFLVKKGKLLAGLRKIDIDAEKQLKKWVAFSEIFSKEDLGGEISDDEKQKIRQDFQNNLSDLVSFDT